MMQQTVSQALAVLSEGWPASDPTPLDRCWECDALVGPIQRRRSQAHFQAVICVTCEQWVRGVLSAEQGRFD